MFYSNIDVPVSSSSLVVSSVERLNTTYRYILVIKYMLNLEEYFWMFILLLYFSVYFKHVFKKLKNIPVHMKTFKPLNSLVTNSKNIGQ